MFRVRSSGPTLVDSKVADSNHDAAKDGTNPRPLAVDHQTGRNPRAVHAQVAEETLFPRVSYGANTEAVVAHDKVLLFRVEHHALGEGRSPCRVGILSPWLALISCYEAKPRSHWCRRQERWW
jgi:hypothetical protein